MWQGIVIGIICVMAFNLFITVFLSSARKKYDDDMRQLMIEGNRLRHERNEILESIVDYMRLIRGEK